MGKSAAQRRLQAKLAMREKRAKGPADDKSMQHDCDRLRHSEKRTRETEQEKLGRQQTDKKSKQQLRKTETSKERMARLEGVKKSMQQLRETKTPEERTARLQGVKSSMQQLRETETPEERTARLQGVKSSMQQLRETKTPEERTARLQGVKSSMQQLRETETPKERTARLQGVKRSMQQLRKTETPKERATRQQKDRKLKQVLRETETREKRTQRRAKDRNSKEISRNTETPKRRSQRLEKMKIVTKVFRQAKLTVVPKTDTIVSNFLQTVKDSANYICCCCHRLLYRMTVKHLNEDKYKCSMALLNEVLAFRLKSYDGHEWICRTCDLTLKRGKMPAQCKANNLSLQKVPHELQDLNTLELRLISQRIPFMKMVGLPRGKQHGIHGPAVNVPSKLDAVCKLFPRLPSESQLVPMKFKRSLKHSSHYMYDYVNGEKVLNALKRLKVDNPHYTDIEVNENWASDAARDDPELWQAISVDDLSLAKEKRYYKPMPETTPPLCNGHGSRNVVQCSGDEPSPLMQVLAMSDLDCQNDYAKLNAMARENSMNIVDVPGDGNCMYYSVCYQLERLGVASVNPELMRKQLANFMRENAENYRDFVSARIATANVCNADTEQPTKTDRAIRCIDNTDTRKELQWITYTDELENGNQWGDHVSLQALAYMFSFTVHVHATSSSTVHTVTSRNASSNDFHLGLIGQSHYLVFEPYSIYENTYVSQTKRAVNTKENCIQINTEVETLHNKDHNSETDLVAEAGESNESDEELTAEDNRAFEESSKIRGLPYETSMMNEDPNLMNKLISVAPGEKVKPMPLLSDPNFEELSHPDKYPDGSNALTADRPVEIYPRRYFNQRLLDKDGRFSKSIEYLLAAQYATEIKQVQSDINQVVFRRASGKHFQGRRLTAGMTKCVEHMNAMIRSDHAYRILKNVRGTPAYFQTVYYDVLAMVRQLGIPTWFFTVSAADMEWPDVIQTIARQYGTELTDEDVKNMSFADRTMWLRSNPVTAARQFQYRLELLFKDVLKSNAHPLGQIVDYVIRIEFQARGSPHAHTLLWVKDGPKLDVDADETVSCFIEKHASCALPDDDPELRSLVERLQIHSHSSYCKKKGSCRFNYPKPPSAHTVVAREPDGETSEQDKESASVVLSNVKETLCDDSTPNDVSLSDLLQRANVSEDIYARALKVSEKGKHIILKRDPAEVHVNAYNPVVLKAWQANIDIQFIVDAYACVMYVAAYMTKNEKGIGELLKQACKEYKDADIKTTLRHIGSVFLNNREVSAQEAVYRILSMPMKKFSRQVLFVNTDKKTERPAVLKPKKELENLDNDDENIFQSNIVLRYAARPRQLDNMCLADFAANYTVSHGDIDEDTDDSIPLVLEIEEEQAEFAERDRLPKHIKLINGKGAMHKRKREAVIRFRRFNIEKDSANFYRAKLMLYLPWRNEDSDLIAGFPDYASHYFAVVNGIRDKEQKYTENVELIDQAIHDHEQYGPPEHAWANIAPGAEHDNLQDVNEGVGVERDIDQEDLDANAELIEMPRCDNVSELVARYQLEADRECLPPSEYRRMVRNLNVKQAEIVLYHRKWCKDAVIAMKQGQSIKPYIIFWSGPGGVGKTHVIKLIHSDTRKLLALSHKIKPSDISVLLTAPNGVAAFNIGGMTVHSALLIRTSKYGKDADHLSFEKLNSLRSKLENLQLLIIDEVSMVGSDMLLDIHKRLEQIKGSSGDEVLFGNVCILAVGDLYQLPPVKQSQIFQPVRDPVERLTGSLWKDHFDLHELDEIMRQKDDSEFAELLCRVRTGKCTKGDVEVLKSREINSDDPDYPHSALHVFAYNRDVDDRNMQKLEELAPNADDRYYIHASDDKTDSTGHVNLEKVVSSQKRSETAGLHTTLVLCEGARVMLTYNIDTADGLVNGVIGTVECIIKNTSGRVTVVLVKFDNEKVGKGAISASQWKNRYPSSAPIQRHEGKYEKGNKKGALISRRQFPLTLAWAVTIHKCQGLTLEQIVVSMKGANRFGKGQAYVAFSRVKTLSGLHILDFDAAGIKANGKLEHEMNEMRNNSLRREELSLMTLPKPGWITVGHLNIHYFLEKMPDLMSNPESEILSKTDIMCFTETYLTTDHSVDAFAEKYCYTIFREDIKNTHDHGGLHGVMICASNDLNPEELPHMSVMGLESKVIVMETESKSRLIVVVVYKKPSSQMKEFLQKLSSLLDVMPLNVPTILLGDFNDDLTKQSDTLLTKCMERYGFIQCVTKPTTDRGTLIDHIYFNMCNSMETHFDVHDTYYSDHDMTFLTTETL